MMDERSGESSRSLCGHSGAVYSVSFSPDRTLLLSASEDTTIRYQIKKTEILNAIICCLGYGAYKFGLVWWCTKDICFQFGTSNFPLWATTLPHVLMTEQPGYGPPTTTNHYAYLQDISLTWT